LLPILPALLAPKKPWYKRPGVWIGIGAVAAVGTGIAYGVTRLRRR
jgi:hypothetical protein